MSVLLLDGSRSEQECLCLRSTDGGVTRGGTRIVVTDVGFGTCRTVRDRVVEGSPGVAQWVVGSTTRPGPVPLDRVERNETKKKFLFLSLITYTVNCSPTNGFNTKCTCHLKMVGKFYSYVNQNNRTYARILYNNVLLNPLSWCIFGSRMNTFYYL